MITDGKFQKLVRKNKIKENCITTICLRYCYILKYSDPMQKQSLPYYCTGTSNKTGVYRHLK